MRQLSQVETTHNFLLTEIYLCRFKPSADIHESKDQGTHIRYHCVPHRVKGRLLPVTFASGQIQAPNSAPLTPHQTIFLELAFKTPYAETQCVLSGHPRCPPRSMISRQVEADFGSFNLCLDENYKVHSIFSMLKPTPNDSRGFGDEDLSANGFSAPRRFHVRKYSRRLNGALGLGRKTETNVKNAIKAILIILSKPRCFTDLLHRMPHIVTGS